LINITAALSPNVTLPNYRLQVQAALTHDSRALLKNITAPTLVMIGAEDVMCLPKYSLQLAAEIQDAKLVVLDNAGHMPFVECEDIFVNKIFNFLGK
jgi:pimeloyl-ACP methyl ester carboxylesterase